MCLLPVEAEDSVKSPELQLHTVLSWDVSCGCRELNPGSLQEQSVLVSAEPSLQPLLASYSCLSDVPSACHNLQKFLPATNSGFVCKKFFLWGFSLQQRLGLMVTSTLHTEVTSSLLELSDVASTDVTEKSPAVPSEDNPMLTSAHS